MNKTELTAHLAAAAGINKVQAQKALEAFQRAVVDELSIGNSVDLPGFGKFVLKCIPARGGFNVTTQQPIMNPPTNKVSFKPSIVLKKALAKA